MIFPGHVYNHILHKKFSYSSSVSALFYYGISGAGVYVIHHGWNPSPLQATLHTHVHTRGRFMALFHCMVLAQLGSTRLAFPSGLNYNTIST